MAEPASKAVLSAAMVNSRFIPDITVWEGPEFHSGFGNL